MGLFGGWRKKKAGGEQLTAASTPPNPPPPPPPQKQPIAEASAADTSVFEFGTSSAGGDDGFTMAGFCPVSNDLEPCRWELLPAPRDSEKSAPLFQKLLVILRDGRKLIGILRSFDQFANVVLEGAYERIIVGDLFCDIPLGLFIIRGENVVLIGELDITMNDLPSHMQRVTPQEIEQAQKAEKVATELKGSMRKRMEFLDLD